jgi:hypothetical protein
MISKMPSLYAPKKRKNYDQWVHMVSGKCRPEDPNTLCGKTAGRISSTTDKSKVTCKRCLEIIGE